MAQNPQAYADAFARAWFKLTHRDMGPKARYIGNEIPAQSFIWQDPLPKADYAMVDAADIAALKGKLLSSGLEQRELIRAAGHRHRPIGIPICGAANGARIRLNPAKGWAVNDPAELDKVLAKLTAIRPSSTRARPVARRSAWPT
jgi:catalase-peroxidase